MSRYKGVVLQPLTEFGSLRPRPTSIRSLSPTPMSSPRARADSSRRRACMLVLGREASSRGSAERGTGREAATGIGRTFHGSNENVDSAL
jgi:hypothetical protein